MRPSRFVVACLLLLLVPLSAYGALSISTRDTIWSTDCAAETVTLPFCRQGTGATLVVYRPSAGSYVVFAAGGAGAVGDALKADPLSQFAATTSAQLAGVLSNETGTGLAVFGTSPTLLGTTTHTGSGTARSIDLNYTRSGDQAASATVSQAFASTYTYTGTNPLTPYHIMGEAVANHVQYGDGTTLTVGTVITSANTLQVLSSGDETSEHAVFLGGLRYDIGTGYTQTAGPSGRGWMADFGMHGPIAVQPELFVGLVMFMNNYYNGSPDNGPSVGMTVTTAPGLGTVQDALHTAATTYPLDIGLLVNGKSTGTGAGWTTGICVGCIDGTWFNGVSKTGTALDMSGYATRGLYMHDRHADGTAPAIIVDATAGPVVFGATAPNGSEKLFVTTTVEEVSRQKGTHATSARFVLESTATDELVWLRTGQVNYILGINAGNNFVLSSTDDHFASAHIMNVTPAGIVGFGFGTTTPVGGGVLVSSPAAQTIAAGNTIAADACGTVKKITAAGAVTTSTVDTFSETWAGSSGCEMLVCNVGANAITLDGNARFVAADVVLAADACVLVGSSGAKWFQGGAPSSAGGLSGGAANKVAYWTSATALSNNTLLHYDAINNNVGIGPVTFGTGLTNGLAFLHDGTNFPSTNITDTVQLYARDQGGSTNSSLFVKAEAGGITSIGDRVMVGNGGILLSNGVIIGGVQLDGAGPLLQLSNVASIAHGITGAGVNTATFFDIRPVGTTDGGAQLRGVTELSLGMVLSSITTTDPVSTKSTTSDAALRFEFGKKFISNPEPMAAGVNLAVFTDVFSGLGSRWILDNDGDTWQAGTVTATQFFPILTATQTIAAGNIVAADACGGIKRITAAGAVTTDTTNTFTAPAAGNSNCHMMVCNIGSNAITLDNNANFSAGGITGALSGTDVVLGADDCVSVGSTGASGKWFQAGAGSTNG